MLARCRPDTHRSVLRLLALALCLLTSGCPDPEEEAPKPVAVVCVVDLTGWGNAYGDSAKQWLIDRLIPWLRGGDTVAVVTIGSDVGDDRALAWFENLPGEGLYDPRLLARTAALAEFIETLAPPDPPQPGTAVWETVDQAASTASSVAGNAQSVVFFLSDLQPDAGESLQPADRPTAPFPIGTKGVILFLPRRGLPENRYSAVRSDLESKLAAVNVTMAVPPMAPGESAQFDPNRVLKRSDSLF